jgi:uncharacterized protein YneF (UPF0154 family)
MITVLFIIAMVVCLLGGIQWGIESNRRDRLVREQLRERKERKS